MSKTNKLLILFPVLIVTFFLGITDMFQISSFVRTIFTVVFFIVAFIFVLMSLQKVPYKACSTDTCKVNYQDPDKLKDN